MKKRVFILFVFIFGFCEKPVNHRDLITTFFETRKKAYEQMDVKLMMTTFHPDFQDNSTNFHEKEHFFNNFFKMAHDYYFEYKLLEFTKRDSLFYVRYNFKLEKNMKAEQGRAFSQNFNNQMIVLINKEGKMLEYGQK